jgi:hypothetical protein
MAWSGCSDRHRRPGFYFRVLQEGEIDAGDQIVKIADGPQRMTVAEIDALLSSKQHAVDPPRRVVRNDALSPGSGARSKRSSMPRKRRLPRKSWLIADVCTRPVMERLPIAQDHFARPREHRRPVVRVRRERWGVLVCCATPTSGVTLDYRPLDIDAYSATYPLCLDHEIRQAFQQNDRPEALQSRSRGALLPSTSEN